MKVLISLVAFCCVAVLLFQLGLVLGLASGPEAERNLESLEWVELDSIPHYVQIQEYRAGEFTPRFSDSTRVALERAGDLLKIGHLVFHLSGGPAADFKAALSSGNVALNTTVHLGLAPDAPKLTIRGSNPGWSMTSVGHIFMTD